MNDRGRWAAARLAAIALLAAAVLGGCSDGAANRPIGHVVKPREPAPFELKVADRLDYENLLVDLEGKVVLVDCWATWCLPCVEQLPHTVALDRKYRDAGLAVVTLSLDAPANSDEVRKVLLRNGAGGLANLTNLISQYGPGSASVDAFEVPGGALPCYKLYDRKGELRRTFALDPAAKKQFTPADVEQAVKKLLAE
jgi:thiol-disulfide isomerase/thioredoxin